ncbi:nicotinamide adenine dinucleotide transporter 1, chloroplastic-like isoform X1 [Zingiber officinale]|uniref:nicotinamide adenine dinucleotide transporter 1, chloroplastic-like isoform X1 n=1 Tax=Zingiber officinale TaxID=94328 RepID=UPI001C4CC440|nr:nicotinamide adenine dinucleotide transporter 1, chloroplastic-like isoform X1 [Zingiber officinale]
MGGGSDGKNGREILCDALAGASAGAVAATFVCPLDVIKTRLQVHGPPEVCPSSSHRNIIISSLKQIIKKEGVSGLYRGLTPTVTALLPNWAVYFPVYNHLKSLLHSHVDENNELSVGANILAAAGAGAATAITTNPLWVVKTRLQTQGMRDDVVPYKGMLSALRRIMLEEGRRGLYSGLLPSLVGVSHVAIQFPSYEKIKSYLARKENTSVDRLSPKDVAISSSLSKIIASTLTYPHEVIRARLQEQGHARNNSNKYAGVTDCIRKVFHQDGIPGFYRGYATNLLRTTPSAVITFTSYEMIHRFFLQAILS